MECEYDLLQATDDNVDWMAIQIRGIKLKRCSAAVFQELLDDVADDPRNKRKLQIGVVLCGHVMRLDADVRNRHLVVAADLPHLFSRVLANLSDITLWVNGSCTWT